VILIEMHSCHHFPVRYLGVDFGARRIGLALSDASAVLARPWETLEAGGTPEQSASRVAAHVSAWMAEADEALAGIVVGLPRKLNGSDTEQTQSARAFAAQLREESGCAVHLQDERLTSHEAEERLKTREPNWRARKRLVDAEAAAIILQDFLDRPRPAEERTAL
jgi:putative holliday junction resolvase